MGCPVFDQFAGQQTVYQWKVHPFFLFYYFGANSIYMKIQELWHEVSKQYHGFTLFFCFSYDQRADLGVPQTCILQNKHEHDLCGSLLN